MEVVVGWGRRDEQASVGKHPALLVSPVTMYIEKGRYSRTTPNSCDKPLHTSSNLLEPQHHRASKVWRGLSHEFGVVRLYRTFSSYIIAGETRCAGCLCTSSGWVKHIAPQRTYTNHSSTELARCVEVSHMRSGWFDCTEPSLCTLLQGKQGVQGAYAIVRGGSSTSNLLEPTRTTTSQS